MADKEVSKPAEPPKPVHIGGESLLDRLLPHIKKITIGVILTAVLAGTIIMFRSCKRAKQERETAKVETILEVGQRPIAMPGVPPDPKNPTFADEKERAQKILDEMAKQNTDAAGPGFRASVLMDAGKIDEAITEYRTCETGTSIEAVLCREGLGIAVETKAAAEKDPTARQKGLESALEVFNRMQPAEDGPRRAYAIYHQGRIQLSLGKPAEGRTLLEKAKELKPPKELVELIDRRLASIGAA